MKQFAFVISILLNLSAFGQEVQYLKFGEKVCCKDSADVERIFEFDSIADKFTFRDYWLHVSHGFIREGQFSTLYPDIKDGLFLEYDALGNELNYEMKCDTLYKMISYKEQNGNILDNTYPYNWLNEKPNYYLGMEVFRARITDNIRLDSNFSETWIMIAIVINDNGVITDYSMLNLESSHTKNSLSEIFENLKLNPGIFNGKKVGTVMIIPIKTQATNK
jgi:hypothetical protein